ncbi:MAG TPA: acyltransferase [Candidatus Solibacter sp.]|nr:acyltransferase [Candidatus Solibacter sp.]
MRRIPSLDGLRAISITLVILGHLAHWKHVPAAVLGDYGLLGVQVFFVLSGYLITNLLLREYDRTAAIDLREFYIRRAYRILPAAFLFLAVASVIYWREITWYHVAAAAFYVANLDPSRPWMFIHLWSLSVEEQFYLIWPLAVKKWHRHKTAILLCAFWLAPVIRTAVYAFKLHYGIPASLPAQADQLAIGCLLAIYASRVPKIRRPLALLMLLVVVFFPWFPATSAARTLFMLFVLRPILFASIAGLVLHVIQHPYRALNWAPIAWLGKISYGLYLWQQLFCGNPALEGRYALILPILACACISYYLLEQPLLRLRERRSRNQSGYLPKAAPAPNMLPAPAETATPARGSVA